MDIKDIYKELEVILENTLKKANNYKYFENGQEKLLQNTPAIKSLCEVARELIVLGEKIEKECNLNEAEET